MTLLLLVIFGAAVGLALGLTGGGGAILAVPLLFYGADLPLRTAVTVSLAVVGLTAVYGAILQRSLVLWKAGGLLGLGGILGAPFGAWLGVRISDEVILVLFVLLMLTIAFRMLTRGSQTEIPLTGLTCRRDATGVLQFHWSCAFKVMVGGAVTGVLSGLFGVGGGFLAVPVLLVITGMSMANALATSLVGIALISAMAFWANAVTLPSFPWTTAWMFLVGGGVGMTVGAWIKPALPEVLLRKLFAVALVLVAAWILIQKFV